MCVEQTLDNAELMAQYRRLTGSRVGLEPRRSPIEAMVDKACGFTPPGASDEEWRAFFDFVRRAVWIPWAHKMTEEMKKMPTPKVKK